LVTLLDNLFQELSDGSAELFDPLALKSGDEVVVVDAGGEQQVEELIRVLQVGLER
jgi:electron transfer flavoprotein alpha/beta subunit